MNTLIKNAWIVDGTGKKPFLGSVGIENNTIQFVTAEKITEENFIQIIDAKKYFLTPGFIDVHSHADYSNFTPGDLCPKISQGITTEIVGQCGFSTAPIPKHNAALWRSISIIDDHRTIGSWESTQEYFIALKQKGLESNLMAFVGATTLRFAVVGNAARTLTNLELLQLEKLATESFLAGAAGLSFGLIFDR